MTVGARVEWEAEEPLKQHRHFCSSLELASVSGLCHHGEENAGVNACSHQCQFW